MTPVRAIISNMFGIERADIEAAPIAALFGRNWSGKSSACRALAAALSGQCLPVHGITKGTSGAYVRDGAESGAVRVTGEGWGVRLTYPGGERSSDGKPPEPSVYAVGLASIVDLPPRERATALAKYVAGEPTQDDLAFALDEKGVPVPYHDRVWTIATERGWDGAHAYAKEQGAKLKGKWEGITSARYGSDKAAHWLPTGYQEDGGTVEEREGRVAAAKTALERAVAKNAISTDEFERMAALAGGVYIRSESVKSWEKALAERDDAYKAAHAARNELPPSETDAGAVACPHCDGMVVGCVVGGRLASLDKAGEPMDKEERKKRRIAIASADGELARARGALNEAKTKGNEAKHALADAEDAASWLKEHKSEKGESGGEDAVAQARTALDGAEKALAAATAKEAAEKTHASIAINQAIVAVLAPDGLRARILARGLTSLNADRLRPVARAAEWRETAIEPDLSVTYGGRSYSLLSASEQWRARATLAVAMALIEGHKIAILDGADILDQAGRNGLMQMLVTLGLTAVLGMTLNAREKAPDLAKMGIGRTYWVESGIATPLHAAAEKAA